MPLAALGARHIPHGTALGAPVDPDVDLQVPGAVAVTAVQEVAELDAVGVVLAEREQEQLSPCASKMLRGIDHHEGPWKRRQEKTRQRTIGSSLKCLFKFCSSYRKLAVITQTVKELLGSLVLRKWNDLI